jgi:glycine dehydrogenase subunit 2
MSAQGPNGGWRIGAGDPPGASGLVLEEPLIFERGSPGRCGASLPAPGVPEADPATEIPAPYLRGVPSEDEGLPAVSEPEVVRHITRLSQWNYGIDTGMFPLGSCTMKYNPRVNEAAARLPGLAGAHPYLPEEKVQGPLALMWHLERALAEIGGFAAVTLQPAAGAQGELAGVLMIRAWHEATHGRPRSKVLVPASAHGTNPATSALAGYGVVEIKAGPDGYVLPETVAEAMNEEIAGILITNPNTLGIFERHIAEIAKIVHDGGGLVYCDGANMNALLGKARPGDMGIDVMHYNLHKTFSTPHGGGGPGAGPVGVSETLVPFLPAPVVTQDGEGYRLDYERPQSIGRLKAFYGNFGVLVRAYTFIRELGAEGLREACEAAVLNAAYVRDALLKSENGGWHLPFRAESLHEAVFSDKHLKETGCTTMDVAKRLIDLGFHPPTVYFPLVVAGALMIEPTETETRENLDAFVAAMARIAKEAREAPELLHEAPVRTVRRRLDETRAARHPILRWTPDLDEKLAAQGERGGKGRG